MTFFTKKSRHMYVGVVILVGCCFGIETANAGSITGMINQGSGVVAAVGPGSSGGLPGFAGTSGPAGGATANTGIVLSTPTQSHPAGSSAYGFDGDWGKPLGQNFFDDGSLRASFTYYSAAGRGGSMQAIGLSLSLLSN